MKGKTEPEMQDTRYEIGSLSQKTDGWLTSSQLHQLEGFGDKINKIGVNFTVCNADGELVLLCDGTKFKSDKRLIIDNCSLILEKGIKGHQSSIIDSRFLAAVLKRGSQPVAVALIDLGDNSLYAMHDANRGTQNDMCNTLLSEKSKWSALSWRGSTRSWCCFTSSAQI